MNRIGTIYALVNAETYKAYIGRSFNYEQRKEIHTKQLNTNHSPWPALQEDYNKYGANNFVFVYLNSCTYKDMKEKEI